MKQQITGGLADTQLLQRLAKLCEDVQTAIDRAHDQRQILEAVRDAAQELLSDAESRPPRRQRRGHDTDS